MHQTVPVAFFFNDTATTEIYPLSLHDALPISCCMHSVLQIMNISSLCCESLTITACVLLASTLKSDGDSNELRPPASRARQSHHGTKRPKSLRQHHRNRSNVQALLNPCATFVR